MRWSLDGPKITLGGVLPRGQFLIIGMFSLACGLEDSVPVVSIPTPYEVHLFLGNQ